MKNTYLRNDFTFEINQDKVKAEAALDGIYILIVRPICHRIEDRIRAHTFLCVLAYYDQWHMTQAYESLIYTNEQLIPGSEIDEDPLTSDTTYL